MSLDTDHKPLILAALRAGDTLTNLEILNRFGCMNGKGRICDLRQDGWDIQGVFIKVKNRFGKTVRVMEYSIPPESRQEPQGKLETKKPRIIPRTAKGTFLAANQTVNQDTVAAVRADYAEKGKPIRDIANKTGLSYSRTRRLLIEQGVNLRHRGQQSELNFQDNTPSSSGSRGEGDVLTETGV